MQGDRDGESWIQHGTKNVLFPSTKSRLDGPHSETTWSKNTDVRKAKLQLLARMPEERVRRMNLSDH